MTERGYMIRAMMVAGVLLAVWGVLVARVVTLHWDFSRRDHILSQRNYARPLSAPRGWIFDRNGNPMALDLTVKDVCVDPKTILEKNNGAAVSIHLARLLGLPRDEVAAKVFKPGRRYEVVARQVPEAVAEQIQRLRLPGVFFPDQSVRHYPQGDFGCHVFGFVNREGVGSAGIEQRFDSLLRGRPGMLHGEKDGRRREIVTRRSLEVAPVAGVNVHLTLDSTVQHFVEQALDEAMEEFHPEAAWAIVQEVRTGAILAMASRPGYNLNAFPASSADERLNRTIGANIEPGSVFKVGVIAAALDAGVITTNDVFFCENGYWRDCPGRPLKDFHHYGNLDVGGVLKKSSNIGAAKIAVLLGPERLYKYLQAFGIGRQTGVGLPGEEKGLLYAPDQWTSASISRLAMGHEVMVTALQMVNMLAAIGNEGYLMQPYIVSRVVDGDGNVLQENEPTVLRRPITERTARQMLALLQGVVQKDGTGRRAAIEGYAVGGKTGTAEKVVDGHYVKDENVASFMGLLPGDAPEVAIIVVADNPKPLTGGGAVAAPVFAKIAAPVARYLDIRPSQAEDTVFYALQQGTRP